MFQHAQNLTGTKATAHFCLIKAFFEYLLVVPVCIPKDIAIQLGSAHVHASIAIVP